MEAAELEQCGYEYDMPDGPCTETDDLTFDALAGEHRCPVHQTVDPYDVRDDEPPERD